MTINPEKIWARGFGALAIAALAIVALASCSLLGQATGGGIGTDSGDGEGTDTSAFAIKVGDCLNDGDVSGEVESVPVVAAPNRTTARRTRPSSWTTATSPAPTRSTPSRRTAASRPSRATSGTSVRRVEVLDLLLLPHRSHLGQR